MQRKNGLSLIFSLIPRSISRRLRQLTGKTAGELLRLLCELTIGFRQSAVRRSYRQLGQTLGKSVETIARAAKLLLRSGDVVVESRPGQSYLWSVFLEESDIRADPAGICLVRPALEQIEEVDSPVEASASPPQPPARSEEKSVSVTTASEPAPGNEDPGDSSGKFSALLKRLLNIGMRRRLARELVESYEHTLIEAALGRVKGRSDIKNLAAYVLCDVKDGGYEDQVGQAVKSSGSASRPDGTPPSSESPRIYNSAERTRAELAAMEHERIAAQQSFQDIVKNYFQRFEELPETVKEPLKQCWQKHLADLVPRTSRRDQLMESQAFKKVAFKEVMEPFFAFIDQGTSAEQALARVSSA